VSHRIYIRILVSYERRRVRRKGRKESSLIRSNILQIISFIIGSGQEIIGKIY